MSGKIEFKGTAIKPFGGITTFGVMADSAEDARMRMVRQGYRDVQVHDHLAAAQAAPIEQPVETAKLLDALPGLVGAIDKAVIDQTGKRFPFVLLVFGNGAALHATNIDAKTALNAVQEFAAATAGDAS